MFFLKKALYNLFTGGRYGLFEDSEAKKKIQALREGFQRFHKEIEEILYQCGRYQFEFDTFFRQKINEYKIEAIKDILVDAALLREADVGEEQIRKCPPLNFYLSDYFKKPQKYQYLGKEILGVLERVIEGAFRIENHRSDLMKSITADGELLKKILLWQQYKPICESLLDRAKALEGESASLLNLNYKTYLPEDQETLYQMDICAERSAVLRKELDEVKEGIRKVEIKNQEVYLRAIGFVEALIDDRMHAFSSSQRSGKYELTLPIELELSDNFSCVLRKYQAFGVKYFLLQKRILIGDEMGLGKTVQALAAIDHLFQKGVSHVLIVVPASLIPNWESECRSKTKYDVSVLIGSKRKNVVQAWLSRGGIGIVSYTTFGNDIDLYQAAISEQKIFVIADEAEYVKNPHTQRSLAFKKMTDQSEYVLLLTGTPLQNRLAEFRQLIKYLDTDLSYSLSADPTTFREQIKSHYLRRNRIDVLHELPEKTEIVEWVEMTDEEAQTHLHQLENYHFMQYRYMITTETKSKKDRLFELIHEHMMNYDKILVFSFFKTIIDDLDRLCTPEHIVLHGEIPVNERAKRLNDFLSKEGIPIAFCQILATGRGLNIQGANAVIIVEPQLNPALEDQAIARVYRMGQRKKVIVHRLIYKGSIEEKYTEINEGKRKSFHDYAHESQTKVEFKEATEAELMTAQKEQIALLKQRLS